MATEVKLAEISPEPEVGDVEKTAEKLESNELNDKSVSDDPVSNVTPDKNNPSTQSDRAQGVQDGSNIPEVFKTEPTVNNNLDTEPAAKPNVDDEVEITPPVPPRPSKPLSSTEITISQLVDIFPTTDLKYIKMALIASEGRLEPASNALLFLSDPASGIEIPNKPTTPVTTSNNTKSQLEDDEALARRLAKSFEKPTRSSRPLAPTNKPKRNSNDLRERYNNFGDDDDDDDLYESITKNVDDAKKIVGGWFGTVSKKLQGSFDSTGQNDGSSFKREPYKPQLYASPQKKSQEDYRSYNNPHYGYSDSPEEAPKLPTRKSTQLYSAVSNTDFTSKPSLKSKIQMNDDPSDLYTDDIGNNESNVKISQSTEKKWTPLKEVDNDPSPDSFLIDDSEDEEKDNK